MIDFEKHLDEVLTILDKHTLASVIILAGLLVFMSIIFKQPLSRLINKAVDRFFSKEEKKKKEQLDNIINNIEEHIDALIGEIEDFKNSIITIEDLEEYYNSISLKIDELKKSVESHYNDMSNKLTNKGDEILNRMESMLNRIESSLLNIKNELSSLKLATEEIKSGQKQTHQKIDSVNEQISKSLKNIEEELTKIESICESNDNIKKF